MTLLLPSDSFKDNIWINTTSIFHVMKLNQSTVLKQWSCFKNHTCYILHYIFESNLFNRKMFCVQRLYALRKLIIYYWFPKSFNSTNQSVQIDFHAIVPMYIAYGTIFLVSLFGNSLIIHIIRADNANPWRPL